MRRTSAAVLALAIVLIPAAAEGKVKARGSVEQAYVTGAKRGVKLTLTRNGHRVARQRAGRLGAAVFRHVKPGRYRLAGKRIKVLPDRSKPPRAKLYRQPIPKDGYGYLTTRDGTRLAINVHLPPGKGPYPTLIEYSGYGYANPAGAESSIQPVANLLGFAVVDVNMRGTGCSGGAFDYFEALQGLDGYDVIETVARQPWVLHHKVGMVGVSYGGISQLFVAARRPPSLAAITPLSVIDNTQTTLYPGGILNTGFALSWAKDRVHDAKPASKRGGQRWALDRIKGGDRTCKRNQALHAEAVDLLKKVRANNYYRPKVADPLSPATFVRKIDVPVFLACQWTDEQTGGHCPNLANRFTGTSRKWFTFTNGVHTDSLDPATFNRWYDFMQIYVARRAPDIPDGVKNLAPVIYKSLIGVDGVTLPDDPIQGQPTVAAARAAFEAQPPVRILFDNGAGGTPGQPYAGFERSFASWPVPGTSARSWYLGAGGALTDAAPTTGGADTFTWNPAARPATDFTGNTGSGGLWTATPGYDWRPNPPGTALGYTSGALAANTTVVGSGALYGWIQSSARDVDLQVTVTEVRPDGHETFVQSGWLRAGLRRLDARRSTELQPVLSLRRKHAAPLPRGELASIAVPLYYQGHVYRAGSRIRVTIAAPGGDQPVWAFADTRPKGTATVTFARSPTQPSRLVLPVVAGVSVPTGLPPCPGLRGEPCRTAAAG
jgi:predicted acyl esterase